MGLETIPNNRKQKVLQSSERAWEPHTLIGPDPSMNITYLPSLRRDLPVSNGRRSYTMIVRQRSLDPMISLWELLLQLGSTNKESLPV